MCPLEVIYPIAINLKIGSGKIFYIIIVIIICNSIIIVIIINNCHHRYLSAITEEGKKTKDWKGKNVHHPEFVITDWTLCSAQPQDNL